MASGIIFLYRTGTTDSGVNYQCSWSSTPNASNNTSAVTINIAVRKTGETSVYGTCTAAVSFGGRAQSQETILSATPGTTTVIFEKTFTVLHDFNGDYTGTVSVSITGAITGTGATSITLDHIDPPASVAQVLANKTETSITMNWTTSHKIDYFWYSTDGGTTWVSNGSISGTTGAYTITGLSANTTYSIKTRVRRADNQVVSESSAMSVTTYSYPYATSMPSFVIGNAVTIGLYNPLGRTCTVKLQTTGGTNLATMSASGTSASGFNGSTAVTAMYGSIPAALSATYRVAVTYGSHTETRTGGTYSVNQSASKPTISGVTYADANGQVQVFIQDDQLIVQNRSTPAVTAAGVESKNQATITSVVAKVGNDTLTLTLSGTTAAGTFPALDYSVNQTLTVTVTDSRGLTATATATMTFAEYKAPTASISARRANNYYSETDILVNATYSTMDGHNTVSIYYEAVEPTTLATRSGYLTNGTTTRVTLDNSFDWEITFRITDSFGGQATTYTVLLPKGVPVIFFDKNLSSVGVNCFPVFEKTFEVDGAVLNRNVITASVTAVTPSSTSTQKISLTDSTEVGDQLTLANGSVTIGSKITKVLASLLLTWVGATTNTVYAYIYKNSSSVATAAGYRAGLQDSLVIPPKLLEVQSGDTISVYVSGTTTIISAELTVEAMA